MLLHRVLLTADAGGPESRGEGQRLMEADQGEVSTGEVLKVSGPWLTEDVLHNHHLGVLLHVQNGGRGGWTGKHNPLLRLRKKPQV